MYESRFGISGPPFQLSPDPGFYFDSRAHHRALAMLRRGLAAGPGCMVVSGEIGAGKTTLVRTLLAELDADVAVSQVVSTQLDDAQLLAAALIGFGVPPEAQDRDGLRDALLAHLRAVRTAGRRALLVVDEAQNLRRDAFESILALLAGAEGEAPACHVLLVGQPELRAMLEGGELRDVRALVRDSFHLGPIDAGETGPYIRHRLQKVGWSGTPSFEPEAFDAIYRATGGIPRRINLLCNRLMLACFLGHGTRVDAALVASTARELRAEVGEAPLPDEAPFGAPDSPRPAVADGTQGAVAAEPGPLLCIAAGHGDHLKAAVLMRALRMRHDLPPVKLVRVHADDALLLTRALYLGIDIEPACIELGVEEGADAAALSGVLSFLFGRVQPQAVVVFDAGVAALAGARVAHDRAIPLVHVGAGLRDDVPPDEADACRQIDALADLLYTTSADASRRLAEEGFLAERVHCVGNLLVDAMKLAMRTVPAAALGRAAPATLDAARVGRAGYAVVAINRRENLVGDAERAAIAAILSDAGRDLLLVWPRHARADAALHAHGWHVRLPVDRSLLLPGQPYADYLALLRGATCVLTDSGTVQEEATVLGVPCLTLGAQPARATTVAVGSNVFVGSNRALATRTLWECIFNGGRRGRVPPLWDGRTAARIAGYLGAWLPAHARRPASEASQALA